MQEAIHLVAEAASWHRRVAEDLKDAKLDEEFTCARYAQKCANTAQAMDMLLRVARLWERTTEE